MNGKSLWQFASDNLSENKKVVLMTVAESSLSSPGKQKFKMLITEDRKICGTIGGGIMEKQLVNYCYDLLEGGETKLIKRLQHSAKTELEHSGLICGGFQTIIFTLLEKSHLPQIKSLINNLNKKLDGNLVLEFNSFVYNAEKSFDGDVFFNYENDESFTYKENVGMINTAYIIGGGHVGLAISEIMKFLDFYVVVFDHRENIFTMDKNIYADEKIITDYKNVNEYIREGNKSYAIIVTPMHTGDKDALGSIINMDLKYIGMMGSRKKIKTVFNKLEEEGFDEKLFEKVHSPIGLSIGAETPQEIAISIASEIIQIKQQF